MISVNKRIEPLNSRTKDWRGTLSEDDRVEVQVGRLLSIYMEKGRDVVRGTGIGIGIGIGVVIPIGGKLLSGSTFTENSKK